MSIFSRSEQLLLVVGDIAAFSIALWLSLALRRLEVPPLDLLALYLPPFTLLFAVWILVYFIAGLYDSQTTIFSRKLYGTVVRAQLSNILIAALFFFLISSFGIAPKTTLAIYLIVSSGAVLAWRYISLTWIISRRPRNALIIADSSEAADLVATVNAGRYPIRFIHQVAPEAVMQSPEVQEQILEFITREKVALIVADMRDSNIEGLAPVLYDLTFLRARFSFIDFARLYESIYNRLPVSRLSERWILEHVTVSARPVHDACHRMMDIVVAIALGIPAVLLHFLVVIAIRFDDHGPVFYIHERIGKDNRPIKMIKYRSMSITQKEKITRVGGFLRRSRIDELPQLWNVLRGDLSLIGPRPELPHLVSEYAQTIPFYNLRHLITPGLSGWAQINDYDVPRRAQVEVEKTITKLSYDLFYIKNRSIVLDLNIALKTIRTLISRSGT